MPLAIMAIFILLALWNLSKNNIKKAKYCLIFAFVWIALLSSSLISSLLLAPLESQYQKLEKIPANIDYILLLGGDKERRTWEGVRLYHQMSQVKIITSGYSRYGKVPEASKISALLQQGGVKKEDILMQTKAKDTEEEAIAIKQRLGENPFILVTSAYHMPRAMMILKAKGLHPIPAPADFNDTSEDSIFSLFQGRQLRKTEKALHEYIGLLWVMLKEFKF